MRRSARYQVDRRRLLAIAASAALSGCAAVTAKDNPMALANGLRGLRFERSGGMLPTAVAGEVDLAGPQPSVTADGRTRPLNPSELTLFASLNVARARAAASPLTPAGAESYQWDVEPKMADGGTASLRWHSHTAGDAALDAKVPGLSGLSQWLDHEVTRILDERMRAKP